MSWKESIQRLVRCTGYVIHRWPNNRFDAMGDSLQLLRQSGYRPEIVIDCGANRGQWASLAWSVFAESEFHLIEPQPSCHPELERLVRQRGRAYSYQTALSEPGVSQVRMLGGSGQGGTGNFVAQGGERSDDELQCTAGTLDALFAKRVSPEARAMLKLDVEGHEIAVLRGGTRLLDAVEVVLSEVSFFDINRSARPLFGDVLGFLTARKFVLYDFACLSQRPRDHRLRMGDAVFVRHDSPLVADASWE